jgi:hypothetical protein
MSGDLRPRQAAVVPSALKSMQLRNLRVKVRKTKHFKVSWRCPTKFHKTEVKVSGCYYDIISDPACELVAGRGKFLYQILSHDPRKLFQNDIRPRMHRHGELSLRYRTAFLASDRARG